MDIRSLLKGNRTTRIIFACVIPAILVGTSLVAYNVTMAGWNAVVKYQSPYIFPDLEPQPGTGRAETGGVLLVIVDGLRLDTSRTLPGWNAARNGSGAAPAGADFVATTGQPSLSDPAAAVIPSGTSQEIHGVTTNWYEGLIKVDNLFTAARRSGKTTAVVAGKGWVDLYGDSIGAMYKFDDAAGDYDEQVFRQAMALLQDKTKPLPDLLVVHFGGVDSASHEYGGTSPEALAAAQKIDGYISQMLASYDLAGRTAILTADHGHIPTGGHGGWEPDVIHVPLVFVGKAVVSGAQGTCEQVDIAPTIAALLGLSMPTETIGTILDQAVTMPVADLAANFIALGQARYLFTEKYAQVHGKALEQSTALPSAIEKMVAGGKAEDDASVKLTAGDLEKALLAAKSGLDQIDAARAELRAARLRTAETSRTWKVALLVLLGLLPLIYLIRNRWFWLALVGALIYQGAYYALFFLVHKLQWSLSTFNEESAVQSFLNGRMLEAALLVIGLGLLIGLVAGWRKKYDGPELAQGAATFSYLVAYILGVQILLFVWGNGIHFGWFIPNLRTGFKFYVDLFQMVPTGVASVLVVPAALLSAKFAPKPPVTATAAPGRPGVKGAKRSLAKTGKA